MELKKTTTAQEIRRALDVDVIAYVPEEGPLNTYCRAAVIGLAGIGITLPDKDGLLWNKGVKIIDVYDDREALDQAIRFYLKSDDVEAHLLLRTDNTISLEINDIGFARYGDGYVIQRLRLPGGDTVRRIACEDASFQVIMRMIMETKWRPDKTETE